MAEFWHISLPLQLLLRYLSVAAQGRRFGPASMRAMSARVSSVGNAEDHGSCSKA